MASIGQITITLSGALCPANEHGKFTLDLNSGEKTRDVTGRISDLISTPLDEDDLEGFLKVVLKLGTRNRTKANAITALTQGVIIDLDASLAP